ncbi:MAG TPA: NAD-dependent epimerase/dehydratase family protein [Bdellovibrionota bacterium]|nr:NAD-dependent epimerase/dehydratase family protein [Bdellovibrionota bacterium]
MRFLITGGAGFIGSHIAEELARRETASQIRIIDDLSSGSEKNLAAIPAKVDFRKGDIRDIEALRSAMEGVDIVFHHAAITSVPRSLKDPVLCNDINVGGTLNVLVAAREAGVNRVLFASSSAVYGENPITPKSEKLEPDPISPYATSKLAGEFYCRMFARLHRLSTVSFRYFNVFGPRQDPNSQYAAVIPKFIDAIHGKRQPTVFGDGEQTRDFVFVKDVVQANLRAAFQEVEPGSVFNVGRGESLSLNQLLELLRQVLKTKIEPKHAAQAPGDIKHSLADVSLIKRALQFEPRFSIEDGLRETLGIKTE